MITNGTVFIQYSQVMSQRQVYRINRILQDEQDVLLILKNPVNPVSHATGRRNS